MATVVINGEKYSFARGTKPLAEMLALEKATGMTYGQWEQGLEDGSARALAAFCWLVWRRNGRAVEFSDIESGSVELDLDGFTIEDDPEPEPEPKPVRRKPAHP